MTQKNQATVYLIPTVLSHDEKALDTIPVYIVEAIKKCQIFFTEQEKTARRFFKKLWKEMTIDEYTWYAVHHLDDRVRAAFTQHILNGETIGIISEAGCPGIADPGQELLVIAHAHTAKIIPLVGPSSILLALMASGLNGQNFRFNGYLPIESTLRKRKIKELEKVSNKENSTQILIETPYRNNALLADILSTCESETFLCIGVDLTGEKEMIQTKKIKDWKKSHLILEKIPAIFLILKPS
ncbi:MAG: SAM-dependent methyltransferase [Bacteroidetes bacterium]|nr:SAM-dependent methyltransferase [Bacteroidota bacterium]